MKNERRGGWERDRESGEDTQTGVSAPDQVSPGREQKSLRRGGAWLLLGCGDQSRIRCLGLEPSLALALPPGREEEVVPPAGWQGG